jgi:hypothetical protein
MERTDEPSSFVGMTPNERLSVAGLLRPFDEAATRRDRPAMVELLQRVEFSEAEAANWVDQVLAHPEIYLRHLRPPK